MLLFFSFLNQDKRVFMTEYSTQTSDNRRVAPGHHSNASAHQPSVSNTREVTPCDVKTGDVTPHDVSSRDVTPYEVAPLPPSTSGEDKAHEITLERKFSVPLSQSNITSIEKPSSKNNLASVAPKSSSPTFSNHSQVVDSRTYAKPPSTPLYRIPKANKPRTLNVKNVEHSPQDPEVSSASIPEESVEVDGSITVPSKTVEVPIHMTSPMMTDSVLKR